MRNALPAKGRVFPASLLQQRTQHPRCLLVILQAAGHHIRRTFIARRIGGFDHVARRRGGNLVTGDQLGDHFFPVRHAGFFREACV